MTPLRIPEGTPGFGPDPWRETPQPVGTRGWATLLARIARAWRAWRREREQRRELERRGRVLP